MKATKLKSELVTKQDFIDYYNSASKKELKACLKNCQGNGIIQKREQDAINALLS